MLTVVTSEKLLYVDIFSNRLVVLGKGGRHTPAEVLTGSLAANGQQLWGILTSRCPYICIRLLYGQDVLVIRLIDSILEDTVPPVTGEESSAVVALIHEKQVPPQPER